MYKEFLSLADLYKEIENDKVWTGAESAERNRYPIRFVLFENFGDFNDFVQVCQDHNVYVQSIEKWMKEGQDDKMLTYSQLADAFKAYIKQVPCNDFVIAPFSEITRFYDNVHYREFDALVKTIRLIASPEESQRAHQRIYVPIIGMQGKMNRFKDDANIHIWEYRAEKESPNYRLILTRGTTYGVRGLEERYTVCADLRHWIALWKNAGMGIKQQIVCSSKCIYDNADYAQPDNAFTYTRCDNAFDFLCNGLELDFRHLAPTPEEMTYWERLAGEIDVDDFQFDDFVGKRFNTAQLDNAVAFVQTWFECDDDFSRWLLKTYYLWKETAGDYLLRVLARCKTQSTSELFSLLATTIFDEPMDENSLHERRVLLEEACKQEVQITEMAERQVETKLKAMAIDTGRGYHYAMKYMSPLTRAEQCLMTEWVGKGLVERSAVQSLFPALYAYLTPISLQLEQCNAWINDYFQQYSLAKTANLLSEKLENLIKEKNGTQGTFASWCDHFKTIKTILHNRKDIEKYYWIDGLGVDWIPFIAKVIEKHNVDGVYLNEVYVGTAKLPTTTATNRTQLEALSADKLEKIGDLDQYAHSAKQYPGYLMEEFRLVEQAVSKVLKQYNGKKVAFVSDHGLSYTAQFGTGLNLSGITPNHGGRCALWTKGTPPADNSYITLEDGQTLCALTHHSLSTKTPCGQGAHGGALPEEVLVPIIIVSGQKNANTYAARLIDSQIVANQPMVRYEIKGMSSIDTPYICYNGADYGLHKVKNDVYESERLNLVATASRVTLHIGSYKQTDNLTINTGAQEDDLFAF